MIRIFKGAVKSKNLGTKFYSYLFYGIFMILYRAVERGVKTV